MTCPTSNNCPLVEADDVTTVYEFQKYGSLHPFSPPKHHCTRALTLTSCSSLKTDVTGYIAVDHSRSLTILSFRGSKSIRNYITDVNFLATTTDICSGCTVDEGFYTSWKEASAGVTAALKATAAANPSYKVVVVGHSLGGAIAAIATAEIRNGGTNADLYTYGQPRFAGSTLSNYITTQNKGWNFRVTHYDDPVPRLPPLALGFVHISPEYYIKTGNGIAVTAADVTELTGSVNFLGNTGNLKSLDDIAAHGWYFNNISACDTSNSLEIFKQ